MIPRRLWNSSADLTEQDFDRVEQGFQLLEFVHQLVVDVQAARGVDDQHVAPVIGGIAAGGAGEIDRQGLFRSSGIDRDLVFLRHNGQLVAGGGTVDIDRNDFRPVPIFRQPARQFAGGSGFARALKADDQEDAGRFVGKAQLRFVAAEDLDQFLIDDADDLL